MKDLAVGFGLGFLVAVQLGPMSLFLIRSTLRSGLRTGLAVGLGIAVVDGLYAALGATGVSPLLLVDPVRLGLGIVGAGVLSWLGLRTLFAAWQVRAGLEGDAASDPGSALRQSLAATAGNPATILSWAALFAATGQRSPVPLVAGVWLGSLTWVTALATLTAVSRRAVGPRASRVADVVAGVGLLGFGGSLGWRSLHE